MNVETTREDLLTALAELGRLFPDWRMGQMLANLALSAGRPDAGAIWDLEDHEALEAARRLIERHRDRQPLETADAIHAIQ